MIDSKEIGLKLVGNGFTLDSLDLGMGTIRDAFQAEGTLALVIDKLNSLTRTGAILPATPFNIFAEMLSGPFDLDVSSSCSRPRTSSSVQNRSSGQVAGFVTVVSGCSTCEKEGRAVLKQL